MKIHRLLIAIALLAASQQTSAADLTPDQRYDQLQRNLGKGWNTWDARTVLNHVYLPYGLAVQLCLLDDDGHRADKFLIGDRRENAPLLHPGPHSYDGSYTSIDVKWNGTDMRVESAAEGEKNIILVTPAANSSTAMTLVVKPQGMWKRGNTLAYDDNEFRMSPNSMQMTIKGHIVGAPSQRLGKEYHVRLDRPVAIVCSGSETTIAEAQQFVESHGKQLETEKRRQYGSDYDCYNAMQSVLGWDNIYDPTIRKVITPVSRIWSVEWFGSDDMGGFTLFCWDTYFAAIMLSAGNKGLAYANAIEITKAADGLGFVPNAYFNNGFRSRDRSQPPVGSMAVWTLYKKYGEKWLLEYLYDELMAWNQWWMEKRLNKGLLSLGSNEYGMITYYRSEYAQHSRYGAILESGLDNSQMYDGVEFNPETSLLEQNDVGISSLYAMDCDYLALIADELGKKKDARQLRKRGATMKRNLQEVWDEKSAFYYNRSTKDGTLNRRTSPTCFYPLLAKVPTEEQARRMIEAHLTNPDEYWGEYVIPATPRNDPAFSDNEYWRGRIWAPLNFLVYMGLRNYNFPDVRHQFAEKSKALLLKSWLKNGYVFENYNATTGEGDDEVRSDKFYHWGALLAYIALMENNAIKNVK